jgi:hypothetical protein
LALFKEKKIVPSPNTYPNLYGWYSFVGLFTLEAQKLWTAVAAVAPAPAAAKPAAKTVRIKKDLGWDKSKQTS